MFAERDKSLIVAQSPQVNIDEAEEINLATESSLVGLNVSDPEE